MPAHSHRPKKLTSKTSKLVASFTSAAQSTSTRRSYSGDLAHFRANGGKIPCAPEIIAEYLAKFAGVLAVATLEHRLIAIHKAHTDKGLTSPVTDRLVKRTMQGIRRTIGVAQRRAKALVKDDLVELLVSVGSQKPLKAARDKALLLIGFAGAFRRSELVALRIEDITPHASGIELLLRKSKTDQEGEGRMVFVPHAKSEERCPVMALARWLELAGIGEGPLFRSVMLVGVGGIKVPRRSYQSRVFRLAGVGEMAAQFPLEFGWASVLESQRGAGVGTLIAAAAAKIASAQGGIFATCREENETIQYVLEKSGFVDIGEAYQSSRGPYINRLLGLKI